MHNPIDQRYHGHQTTIPSAMKAPHDVFQSFSVDHHRVNRHGPPAQEAVDW